MKERHLLIIMGYVRPSFIISQGYGNSFITFHCMQFEFSKYKLNAFIIIGYYSSIQLFLMTSSYSENDV